MALLKLLLLLFAPPAINWLIGRFWGTYRELRLHRLVFWSWVTAVAPAVFLIATGVDQAVDQATQMANEGSGWAITDFTSETPYGPLITQAARRHGLDPALLAAVVKQESRFNPTAVSRAGAMGLGQLMPGTAADLGVTNPFDPAQNLNGSAGYLAMLLNRYSGDVRLALAGYNAGPRAVDRCRCVPANGETPGYVANVTAHYNEYLAASLTIETAVKLLYVGAEPVMSQGWHRSVGLPDGQDWTAGCRTPLYSPVPGVATVTHNGDDGLKIGNTMITVEGPGGKVTLLHGDYEALVGSQVVGGATRIGSEASNGKSTDCHSHVILYNN